MSKRVLRNRVQELIAIKSRNEDRKKRLSNRQVAIETGLSKVTVDKYVNNQIIQYDANVLEVFADYFNCDIDELLVFKEVENQDSPKAQTPAFLPV